jgi:hypothetical protein
MWAVRLTRKASKQIEGLPDLARSRMYLLIAEIRNAGPLRHNWPNFSRLTARGNVLLYHCHIKGGRPTYVACWEVKDKKIQLVEVYYAGTHEKEPY